MQGGYPLSDKRDIPLSSPERGTRAPQGWTPSAESRRTVRRPGQIPSWRRPMQISRISAESGKALEIRQVDTTAHNSQQSHFSMIIYRLLAPSMKNGESPAALPLYGGQSPRFSLVCRRGGHTDVIKVIHRILRANKSQPRHTLESLVVCVVEGSLQSSLRPVGTTRVRVDPNG